MSSDQNHLPIYQKMKLRIFLLIVTGLCLTSAVIDLDNLSNYASQSVPAYINKDNTPNNNAITNEGATLGRVLFYDKRLSANNTIACSSCHLQEFGFSDTARLSRGLNGGLTGRHAMRLVNSRFSDEEKFFWDERATSLEDQSTRPIQDHVEMGFSGQDGDPGFDSLINKLAGLAEYQRLFKFVYGDETITEARIQQALAQFIRSIQSFDSRFDSGFAMVNNINNPFPNFTPQENMGKGLFLRPPGPGGNGAGCNGCHRAPEFDIDPASMNNGVIGVAGDSNSVDLTNTRAPGLRDLVNPTGQLNGALMHNGVFDSLIQVINHYNDISFNPAVNPNLDIRLRGGPGAQGQQLNLTEAEKQALVAFLLTLTGSDVYTNPMYSDPFGPDGKLDIQPWTTSVEELSENEHISVFPNPTSQYVHFEGLTAIQYRVTIYNMSGKLLLVRDLRQGDAIDIGHLENGMYLINISTDDRRWNANSKIIKY